MILSLKQLIAPLFYSVHKSIRDSRVSEFWLKGGRGSTKSSFVAIEIIKGMMSDPEANCMALRKVADTVRGSIMNTFEWAIDVLGVTEYWKKTYSPAEFTYIPTGQKIIMKGLDDPFKLKSIKVPKGYFKYLWFEEVSDFKGTEELRNVQQSVLRGGKKYVKFYTYNPPIDPQAWVNKEVQVKKPNRYVHHSTYKDVPPEWLGEEFIEEAEWLKENNPLAYEHEYIGHAVGIHDAIVFGGKYRVAEFTPKDDWLPYYGADWGFSQDPTCLIKCWIEPVGKRYRLWVEYEAFGKGVELDDIPDLFDKVPDSRKYKIMADCSRPETISHVKSKGFKIEGAPKWQGSVEDGIEVMKSFVEIVIHTRCEQVQEEFRLYSYRIDKMTNEVTPDIVDKFNHGIDAIRYALSKYIKRRSKGRFAI